MTSKKIIEDNLEEIKKDFLETDMNLKEISEKWGVSRYIIPYYFKDIKRPYRRNLVGKKYGKLTVIQFVSSGEGNSIWKCRCDCGNEKNLAAKVLPQLQSCGCVQRDFAKEHIKSIIKPLGKDSLLNSKFLAYCVSARRRGYEFLLSFEDCRNLFSKECKYCGIQPKTFIENKRKTEKFYYNGIDRVNNSLGYFLDNVVTCCHDCNRAKGQRNEQEFLDWAERVYKNQNEA